MIDCKRYKPMDCPVCGEFYFSELDESDVEIYDNLQCPQCGWIYDLEQVEDPKATTSLNGTSLTDYREKYKALIKENPEYNYCDDHYEAVPHACPVCGRHTFPDEGSFEICPICGWQDDSVMEKEPDKWAGNSNELCLNDYREIYRSQKEHEKEGNK